MVDWFFQNWFSMSFVRSLGHYRNIADFIVDRPTSVPVRSIIDKDIIWTFTICPNNIEMEGNLSKNFIEVSFNESKSFLICALRYYDNENNKHPIIIETKILDYIKLDNDYYFPKRMVKNFYYDGKISNENTLFLNVQKISINESIDNSFFEYKIPHYVKVYGDPSPSDKEYMLFHIWGPDNKPVLTLSTREEYNAFFEELIKKMKEKQLNNSPSPTIAYWRICCVAIGIIILILGIYSKKIFKPS
ncbi:MAG: hypothetical protein LBP59_16390 [Planctomycetaceae bacterium]|jgi:hypothetical protein|nr:hypothetical protein [Planctomycetaceae bacterium]